MFLYEKKEMYLNAYLDVLSESITEDNMMDSLGSSVDSYLKAADPTMKTEDSDPNVGASVKMLTPEEMKLVLTAGAKKGAADSSRLVHRSSDVLANGPGPDIVEVENRKGEMFYIDLNKLKSLFLEKPKKVIGQNAKLKKSGANAIFYDLTMPAYHGLYYDEKKKGFGLVKTCPSAGQCVIWCYAAKGGYIQYPGPVSNAAKMLTFLMNKPKEFKKEILDSLKDVIRKAKGKQVIMRWHDAGDFFSTGYIDLALEIAEEMPEVLHYAYTKQIPMINRYKESGKIPENFVFNYSVGSRHENEITKEDKYADVIKKDMFKDLPMFFDKDSIEKTVKAFSSYEGYGLTEDVIREFITQSGADQEAKNMQDLSKKRGAFKKLVMDHLLGQQIDKKLGIDAKKLGKRVTGRIKLQKNFTPQSVKTLKERVSEELNIPIEQIISYPEMMEKIKSNDQDFMGKNNYWHVLVWFGHGDDAAARKEVKGTLLLIH